MTMVSILRTLKRSAAPIPVRCPVSLTRAGNTVQALGKSISEGRATILVDPTNIDPALGDNVTVSFALRSASDLIVVEAKVASRQPEHDHRGEIRLSLGVEFHSMSPGGREAMTALLSSPRALVAFLDDSTSVHPFCDNKRDAFEVLPAKDSEELMRLLDQEEIAALVLGPSVPARVARDILLQAATRFPGNHNLNVVLGADQDLEMFQELVDSGRIYYLSHGPLPDDQLLALVHGAVDLYWSTVRPEDDAEESAHHRAKIATRLLEVSRRLAMQTDIVACARLAVEAITEFLSADSGRCLIFDAPTETLWSRDSTTGDKREESAAAGLVSFVARTTLPVRLDRIGDDPRYDRDADNVGGRGDERFLAAPVTDLRGDGVLAVLAVLRASSRPPFSSDDVEALQVLASYVSAAFSPLLLQVEIDEFVAHQAHLLAGRSQYVFREEALRYYTNRSAAGDLLRMSPGWMRWAYWSLAAILVLGLAYATMGQLNEYAVGPAVIRSDTGMDLHPHAAGVVDSIDIAVGQRVKASQILARLHDTDPSADPARTTGNVLRAPYAAVVTDVRVHAGQHVGPGDVILSLAGESPRFTAVVVLPAYYRPRLDAGTPLRIQLDGYPNHHETLTIVSVSDTVVSSTEARQVLGSAGDAIDLPPGPVVLARADLPRSTFLVDRRSYAYHDAMIGRGEARLGAESILLTLIPGLKAVFHSDG